MTNGASTTAASDLTAPQAPKKGALLVVFFTVMIDLMGFGLMMPLMPLIARDYGASDATAGMLLATYSLMQLFCAPLLGRLSDRYGRRPVLLMGFSGLATSFFVTGLATALWMLLAVRIFSGAMQSNIAVANAYVATSRPHTSAPGPSASSVRCWAWVSSSGR